MTRIFFPIIILLSITLQAFSQTPESFKYQAVVRDAANNLITNQNVSFRLSILEGSQTGNNVYSETFAETTNNFGLVSINVGEGIPEYGDFTQISWESNSYYLSVELDETGSSTYNHIGTSKLNSVPYALHAKTAENTFSGDYSDISNKPTLIGDVTGDIDNNTVEKIQRQNISANSPSTGQVLKWNGTEWTPTNDTDSDPYNEMQVISISNDTVYLSDGGQVYMGEYSNLWNKHGNDIYNNNSGYVGIGTDAPTGKFVVKGDSTNLDTALFEVRNAAGQPIFAVYDGGVRVWVDNTINKANNNKSGFAIGGYRLDKTTTHELFRISPDSARVYYDNENTGSGFQGGFAIESFEGTGGTNSGGTMHLSEDNYFIGHNSGQLTTGLHNVFLGYESGQLNTSGNNNVFMGYQAGQSNVSGLKNVFIGFQAAYNNIGGTGFEGTYNVMIGHRSGYSNQTGGGHVILGYNAATSITTENYMTAIGYSAGAGATGGHNVFIGGEAGKQFGTGDYNVCIGMSTGGAANGNGNTYIGSSAGLHNDGTENVAIGQSAGYGANTFAYNYSTSIGTKSGQSQTTGSYNTFLGHSSGRNITTGQRNVFLGYNAGASETTTSNKLYIANSNTSPPLIYGEFDNDIVKFNSTVNIRDVFAMEGLLIGAYQDGDIDPVKSYLRLTASAPVTVGKINNGSYVGQVLILENKTVSAITILDSISSANTRIAGNCTLNVKDTLMLIWNGENWIEISRSDN